MAVGEAFPIGPVFLLAKSSFPSPKTPTVLSQQELGNPVGKAFANRVGVFPNNLALLAKHAFPVVSGKHTNPADTLKPAIRNDPPANPPKSYFLRLQFRLPSS
jgi:hypothetical protein